MSGPGHLPNLVVVLHSLRKWYSGQVDVLAWPESQGIAKRICIDKQLDARLVPWEPLFRGKSDTYCDKTRLIQSYPAGDEVVFLDADLLVAGSIQLLFDAIRAYGFIATQFNDWVTSGSIIGGRIKSLLEFPSIDKQLIAELLAVSYPSVNSGIFGAVPESPVLSLWKEWTFAARSTFIPDEKTIHLMMAKYMPKNEFSVLSGGAWNCSPKFQPKNMPDEKVVIWHFHGDSNLRPAKSQRGFDMWHPKFIEAMDLNLGGIREWVDAIPNKHLVELRTAKLL
jgi:hypothetical protein